MNIKRTVLLFTLLLSSYCGFSQLQHGEVLNNFRLYDPITDSYFDLSKEPRHTIRVLVFLDHECPYSKLYIERLIKTAKNFSDQDVYFLAIRPSSSTNVQAEYKSMREYAKHFPLPFHYIVDKDKSLTQALHVKKTPSAYVFKSIDNAYSMEYRAAIDDAPEKEKEISEAYLQKAITALLNNKSFKYRYTESVGCVIK